VVAIQQDAEKIGTGLEAAGLSTSLRFGRDDKGEVRASSNSGCRIESVLPPPGGTIGPTTSLFGNKLQTATHLRLLCPAATLTGSADLPFVISTEAQRSGEVCGFSGPFLEMFFLQGES
jgi:hypothetical protein